MKLQTIFEDLATHFARQNQPRHRDHCLVLAAEAACKDGRLADANRLRSMLLSGNPHHLLRPFASMDDALKSSDVRDYIADLRAQWPTEQVESMWKQLGLRSAGSTPATSATAPTPKIIQRPGSAPRMAQREEPLRDPRPAPRPAPAAAPTEVPMSAPHAERPAPSRPLSGGPGVIPADPEPPRATMPSAGGRGDAVQAALGNLLLGLGVIVALGVAFLALAWPFLRDGLSLGSR